MAIREVKSDEEILACYPVVAQLRSNVEQHEFLDRVHDQQKAGYQLVFAEDGGRVIAVAGYRISNSLAWGRYLYVEDLVTVGLDRSSGHGQALMDWLVARAEKRKCDSFHLDSGVQRHAAHRFFLRNRMSITSHHFSMQLED